MNAIQEIHEEENEYLKFLVGSFEIDESVIEVLEWFALNPDQETIQLILRYFTHQDILVAFLLDMFMVDKSDGTINDPELAVIKSLSQYLKIDESLLSDCIFNRFPKSPSLYDFYSWRLPCKYLSHILSYFNDGIFDSLPSGED